MSDDIEKEVRELSEKLETDRELDRAQAVIEEARTPPRKSRLGAWAAVIFVGVPAALAWLLTVLAYSGVYIEPIRSWWTPQRADLANGLIAFYAMLLTVAYIRKR